MEQQASGHDLDERIAMWHGLRRDQVQDRAQVQALSTRMNARTKVIEGLRDLLALEGQLPASVIEEEQREQEERALRVREREERDQRLMEMRVRNAPRHAPSESGDLVRVRLPSGEYPRAWRLDPLLHGEDAPQSALAAPPPQADRPSGDGAVSQAAMRRRHDTVQKVTEIVHEMGPITRAGIRAEFTRRGWVSPDWQHPNNTIGNAILRARDREKSIVQSAPGVFVAVASIPAVPDDVFATKKPTELPTFEGVSSDLAPPTGAP